MTEPLTPEQIDQIARESKNAADKSLARYRKQALTGFCILLAGVAFSLYDQGQKADDSRNAIVQSGKVIAVDGCNRDFNSISQLRALLVSGSNELKRAYKSGDYGAQFTRTQYIRARKFYRDQLEAIPLPDCRKAESVLTSDNEDIPPVPTPLYPKAAK